MKLLRIGVVVLVIGVSLLVATNLRNRSVSTGSQASSNGLSRPFLLEPRETIIVLLKVKPSENLTMTVVDQHSWNPTQDISEAHPAFVLSGLRQFDAVVFRIGVRGLYYVVITTETGELTGETDLAIEQRGIAEDLLWASGAFTAVGIAIVVVQSVRTLRRRR
jgi:hypothetical protein